MSTLFNLSSFQFENTLKNETTRCKNLVDYKVKVAINGTSFSVKEERSNYHQRKALGIFLTIISFGFALLAPAVKGYLREREIKQYTKDTSLDLIQDLPLVAGKSQLKNEKVQDNFLVEINGEKYEGAEAEFIFLTHSVAEHMSQMHLSGNDPVFAIGNMIILLQSLAAKSEFTEDSPFIHLANLLNDAIPREIRVARRDECVNSDLEKRARELDVGQSMAMSSSTSNHAMIMLITCTSVKNDGEKTYKLAQHNTGGGIHEYHSIRYDRNGKIQYRTVLEYEDISQDQLSESFFKKITSLHYKDDAINEVYRILAEFGPSKKIDPHTDDPRLWSHDQKGGSCSAQCLISLIRSQLTKEKYDEFKTRSRKELLITTTKQIQNRQGDIATKRIVALEVIAKLQRHYARRNQNEPEWLKELR